MKRFLQLFLVGLGLHPFVAPAPGIINSHIFGIPGIPGLVGRWSMDEGTGTISVDGSGAGNTCLFSNTPTWGTGQFGSCVTLNGTAQYGKFSAAPAISYPITMMAWVKLTSSTPANNQVQVVISQIQLSTAASFYFSIVREDATGGAQVRSVAQNSTATDYRIGYKTVTLDTSWHHYAVILQSTTVHKIYIDGSEVTLTGYITAGAGTPAPSGMNTTFFGALYYNSTSFFGPLGGSVDESRIYNRALTAQEISDIYTANRQ